MFKNVLSLAFTSAILASSATAARAEEADSPCAKDHCAASCPASSCTSVKDRLIAAGITSESESCSRCTTTSCCDSGGDCPCCAGDALASKDDRCEDCAHCRSAAGTTTTIQTASGPGTGCPRLAAVGAGHCECPNHFLALHARLVQECKKNAALTARLQVHAELAQAREDFAKRMLKKETEVANLQAELRLASERTKMSQKVGGVMAENARLLDRIVALEKQLETLRVRLANQPADGQVK